MQPVTASLKLSWTVTSPATTGRRGEVAVREVATMSSRVGSGPQGRDGTDRVRRRERGEKERDKRGQTRSGRDRWVVPSSWYQLR